MTPEEAVRQLLERRPDVRLAYLFGSAARGAARHGSDVDVAVLFEPRPHPRALDQLSTDLERAAGRRVDLVDLALAPPLLSHEIVATDRRLVCRSEDERIAFETGSTRRYLDTAHLRRLQHAYLSERAETRRARSS